MVLFAKRPRNMTAVAIASLALVIPASSAFAIGGLGDIVYDPSNYAEAIKQVQSWEQQFQQMTQALAKADATVQQLQTQVSSTTGNRGFGDLLNNPSLMATVPTNLPTTMSSLNSTGTLTGNAATIRSSTAVYNCADVTDAASKVACQALLGQAAQAQAVQQTTMALLNQRTTQIDALRGQIDATNDPKAIAELQARLTAELAQVANDQNKIALMNAMLITSQQAAAQTRLEQSSALMATNKTSVLDGFSFTSLGTQPTLQTAAVDQ
jgi:type IV secretion system protein VirB5